MERIAMGLAVFFMVGGAVLFTIGYFRGLAVLQAGGYQ